MESDMTLQNVVYNAFHIIAQYFEQQSMYEQEISKCIAILVINWILFQSQRIFSYTSIFHSSFSIYSFNSFVTNKTLFIY